MQYSVLTFTIFTNLRGNAGMDVLSEGKVLFSPYYNPVSNVLITPVKTRDVVMDRCGKQLIAVHYNMHSVPSDGEVHYPASTFVDDVCTVSLS